MLSAEPLVVSDLQTRLAALLMQGGHGNRWLAGEGSISIEGLGTRLLMPKSGSIFLKVMSTAGWCMMYGIQRVAPIIQKRYFNVPSDADVPSDVLSDVPSDVPYIIG